MNTLKKNEFYIVTIDGYTSEGLGVCHVSGCAVFVPYTLSGETWEIRIVKVSSSAIYARAERLITASPRRNEPDCPCYARCGGCDLRHMDYREELRFKLDRVNAALQHIGKQTVLADEILGSVEISHYRNKGIYAVSEIDGVPQFGFYRGRSHELIPIRSCALQQELSCRCAAAVVAFMREDKIAAYDEATGRGVVRHIFTRQAVHSSDAVLCIVAARGFGAQTGALVDALRQSCPELSGIVLNINKTRGNSVLSGDFYTLWGKAEIRDSLCGLAFDISPQAFFQINPPQAERLYEKAIEYAEANPSSLVLDLYCGTGTIGLCMARSAGRVIGAEIIPEAIENAKANAERNRIGNAEFICADAAQAAKELAARGTKPDVIVVDPPRKGLSQDAVSAVASMQPTRVVYVSCNPSTLARDILRFQELGYVLQKATAVDMFPRTKHVETVCLLTHKG